MRGDIPLSSNIEVKMRSLSTNAGVEGLLGEGAGGLNVRLVGEGETEFVHGGVVWLEVRPTPTKKWGEGWTLVRTF